MKNVLKFLTGLMLLVLGLGLVIKDWAVLAAMVKASAGIVIALIGIVMMFAAGLKR